MPRRDAFSEIWSMLSRCLAVLAILAMPIATPTLAVADTLAGIAERGTIRLGVRTDATAFSFTDQLGEPAGYTVQLCRAVAADLKDQLGLAELTTEYVEVTTEDRFDAITEGRIDLLCGATTVTLARRAVVDFSVPTFLTGMGVLYRADGPASFTELAGKSIGVRQGTTTEDVLETALTGAGLEATFVGIDSHQQGVEALKDGSIDAYFADRAILIFLALSDPEPANLRVSERLFSHEPYALAMPLGDTAFRLAVDTALSRVFRSEMIERIYAASFGDIEPGDVLRALYLLSAIPD
jgi:polar amino acid transport system substrate-binding protein/glutamate/aspartate transport system substrate-binding protein